MAVGRNDSNAIESYAFQMASEPLCAFRDVTPSLRLRAYAREAQEVLQLSDKLVSMVTSIVDGASRMHDMPLSGRRAIVPARTWFSSRWHERHRQTSNSNSRAGSRCGDTP